MFCKNCGKDIPENSINCQNCGAPTNNQLDTGSNGWLCLGCCVPIARLILYFVWKDERPKTAKKCIIGCLITIALTVIFYAIYFIFLAGIVVAFGL